MEKLVKRGRQLRRREQHEHVQGGMEVGLQAPLLPATQSMTRLRVEQLSVSSGVRLLRFTASLLHILTCSVLGSLYKPSLTFLIYKTRIVIVSTLQDCCKN